jgi:hypothetical protein
VGLKGAPGTSGGRAPEGKPGVDGGITARPLRGKEGGDRDDEWDPLVSGGASESSDALGQAGCGPRCWLVGSGAKGGRRSRERAERGPAGPSGDLGRGERSGGGELGRPG